MSFLLIMQIGTARTDRAQGPVSRAGGRPVLVHREVDGDLRDAAVSQAGSSERLIRMGVSALFVTAASTETLNSTIVGVTCC